jgi:hypothetical protein
MKTPTIKELSALVRHVKKYIGDEYRAFEEDELPSIQLTVGWNAETGAWSYQTGDNSYMGSAYLYPTWAVVGVYRRSNSVEIAREIINELLENCDDYRQE